MARYDLKAVNPTSAETAFNALQNAANFQRNAFDTVGQAIGNAQNFVSENQYKDINNKLAQLNPQDRPKAVQQLLATGNYGALNSQQLHRLGYEDLAQDYGLMTADTAANKAMKQLSTQVDFAEDYASARAAYEAGDFKKYNEIQNNITNKLQAGRGRYIDTGFTAGDPNKWKLGYAEIAQKDRASQRQYAAQMASARMAAARPVQWDINGLGEALAWKVREKHGTNISTLNISNINELLYEIAPDIPPDSNEAAQIKEKMYSILKPNLVNSSYDNVYLSQDALDQNTPSTGSQNGLSVNNFRDDVELEQNPAFNQLLNIMQGYE